MRSSGEISVFRSSEKYDNASFTEETEDTTSNIWEGGNIIFHCLLNDEKEFLTKILSDEQDPFHKEAISSLNCKNREGRTPLDLCCLVGRPEILRLLIKFGSDISQISQSGYSPVHLCACWGQAQCLKILLENGLHLDGKTKYGETPRQLACRYNHLNCVELIDELNLEQEIQAKKQKPEKKKSLQHSKKKKH